MKRQLLLLERHVVLRMPWALHILHSRFPDLLLACIGPKPDFLLCAFKIYKISQFQSVQSEHQIYYSQFRLSKRSLYLLSDSDLILLVLALALGRGHDPPGSVTGFAELSGTWGAPGGATLWTGIVLGPGLRTETPEPPPRAHQSVQASSGGTSGSFRRF